MRGSVRLSTMCSKIVCVLLVFLLLPYYACFAVDTLRISAKLDTLKKHIVGVMEYRLPSEPDLKSFEFQLYPNLYSSEESPYLKKKHYLLNHLLETHEWGGMDIDSVLVDEYNLSKSVQVNLTKGALVPDKNLDLNSKTVRIFFTTYIPGFGDRLSHIGDEYMLGNWFPSPALLKKDGTWYNPVYGAFAEPVGEYFHYEMDFTLPNGFLVAAPVKPVESPIDDTLINLHFSFGPALDFALALSPHYMIDSSNIEGTSVRIYYRDYEKPIIERIKTAVQYTLEYMNNNVGEYVYDNLTFALTNASSVGGIEYPGFIVLTSPRGGLMATRFYETLVVHETVHQWFYGMIGSDQVESPWMDESIANFFTHKIVLHYWGSDTNLLEFAGLEFTERDNLRALAQSVTAPCAVDYPTYAFKNESEYFGIIYFKGSLAQETFDNILGDSLSNIFWKRYYELYSFKHPSQEDFINLAGEIAGDDVRTCLEILLNSPVEIDYCVNDLKNKIIDSTTYEISFEIEKHGALLLPVKYRIILYNGNTLDGQWTPAFNSKEITVSASAPAKTVIIDPDNIIAIDGNMFNNSVSIETDNRPGVRLSSGLMFLLESFLSFIGGM